MPIANHLHTISTVNIIWKKSSSLAAVASLNGAFLLSGGPCTARKAQLRQISNSTVPSNHGHSMKSMNLRRTGLLAGSRKQEREE